MPNPSRHVVVIGGGVFGLAAAIELRQRGWSVSLIDRGIPPHPRASSTDVSKVIRMDYGRDDFFTDLAARAMSGWNEWNRRFDRPLFHRDGFLLLSRTPLEPGGFEYDSMTALQARGQAVERLSADDIPRRFPAWAPGVHVDGYLSRAAGWAESGEVVRVLAEWAIDHGVVMIDETAIAIEEGANGPRVRCSSQTVEGDLAVVAAGAWTARLLPELELNLIPRAMPVVHIRPANPGDFAADLFPVWGADISRTGWYGFPALADGAIKIGHHGNGWSDDPDSADRLPDGHEDRLRVFLREAIPGLATGEIVHQRLCFYCDATDGAFWVDRVPARKGVVVASGGSGHGFKFGPVIGSLIADAAEGVANPELARLAWRPAAKPDREQARCSDDG